MFADASAVVDHGAARGPDAPIGVQADAPSGPTPSGLTLRFDRVPSSATSKAVSRAANDSATMRVLLSDVMTIPFGKAISLATYWTSPSGVTSAILSRRLSAGKDGVESAKSS